MNHYHGVCAKCGKSVSGNKMAVDMFLRDHMLKCVNNLPRRRSVTVIWEDDGTDIWLSKLIEFRLEMQRQADNKQLNNKEYSHYDRREQGLR